jgi:antitoxin component YwqK of YwqJK toxin-antitoxin module
MKRTMKLLWITFFALISTYSLAQTQQVLYFKYNGQKVPLVDSADYIRAIRSPDSGSVLFNISEFYRNGKPKLIGKSSTFDPPSYEGQCVTYYSNGKRESVSGFASGALYGTSYVFYPSGKLHAILNYDTVSTKSMEENMTIMGCMDTTGKETVKDGNGHFIDYNLATNTVSEEGDVKGGKPTGEWKGYYPNEKITYTDTYADGKFISGITVLANGTKYTYTRKNQSPEFKGGDAAIIAIIKKKVKYPAALKLKTSQAVLSFIIDRTGKVVSPRMLGSITPELDKAIMATLTALPAWKPALQNGRPVNASWVLPITFGPEPIVKKPVAAN